MKKTLIILLLTLTALTSCSKEEEKTVQKYYKTGEVSTGTISVGTSYVGYTDSFNRINLAPKQGGKIVSITKSEGDTVRSGELIASLDNNEAEVGYQTAGNIAEALYSMKESTSEMFDKQIEAIEAKIETAKTQSTGIQASVKDTQNIAINNLEAAQTQIEKAKVGLNAAKTNLENTKNTLTVTEKHIYDNTKNAITQSIILDTNIIGYIDGLLGVTSENRDKNDDIEDYLGRKSTSQLSTTKENFKEVNKIFLEYKTIYEEKIENKDPSMEEIKEISSKGIFLAEQLKTLLKNTYDTVDNSIANVKLTQETINSYKNDLSSFGEKIEASLITVSGEYMLGLKGSLQNMDSFDSESQLKISILEKQISIAEEDLKITEKAYDNYKANSKGNLTNINTQKKVSEKSIKELEANIESLKQQKTAKLKEIDTSIKQSKGEQNLSSVMINNGQIYSSIDGIVIQKNFEVGEIVGMGMPILTVATNSEIKIVIGIPDELGKKLVIGNKVNVELIEGGKQKQGTIKKVSSTKNEITKNTQVEISIENTSRDIKIGTMVKVYFDEASDIGIVVPNKSIISKFMVPGVMIKQGNIANFKEIKIIKQSDNFSLVEGVELGEKLIIEGQENIYDGEEL